jgi:hypothetical protein
VCNGVPVRAIVWIKRRSTVRITTTGVEGRASSGGVTAALPRGEINGVGVHR